MTTITVNPSASNHDARQAAGPVTLTGAVTIVGGSQWGGLLLPGVSVPAGATINSATLYYQSTSTSHDDPAIYWYAQAADNAAVFTTTDNDIVNRSRTSAYVTDSASDIGTGTYRAITITSLIAEVVGRAGWVSGNNIALIADGQTGVDLWIASYDTGSNIWYVEIDYTAVTPQTVTLNTLSAAVSAVSLAVAPGVVVIAVNTLNAALSGVQMAVVPGARAVALNTLAATLEAVDLTVAPGGVVILLDTHAGTLSAVALSVQGAANIVVLDTLTGNLSAVSLTVAPGEAVASLNTLIGLLQVMELTVGQGIGLSTLSAALSAVPLVVAPGEAAISLASLMAALSAVGLAVIPGAAAVELDTLTALLQAVALIVSTTGTDATVLLSPLTGALSAVELGVIPGEMVVALQSLTATLQWQELIVYLLLGCAIVGHRGWGAAAIGDYAPLLIQVGDRGGCCS